VISNPLVLSLTIAPALATMAAQPPSIAELAPDSSVLIAGIDSAALTMERLKRTPIWDLWQSEQMLEMRAEFMGQVEEGLDEMLQELGLEREAVQPPTGQLGFVFFVVEDEEMGLPGPGFLMVADYGENADQTAELFEAAMKKAEEEGELQYEERDISGRTVRCFDLAASQEQGEEEGQWDEEDEDLPPGMEGMSGPQDMMMQFLQELYFVREGSAFLLCSNMEALQGAFEVCDGAAHDGLAQREDFRAVMRQIGDNDFYAALLLRDLGPLIAANDPTMMMMTLGPMLGGIIGDIKGFGMGYRLDGPVAMLEQTVSVYMPNGKAGLTALLDTQTPRGELPAFVGPNALSYTAMNFEFDGVPALVERVMSMLPFLSMPPGQGEADAPSPQEMIAQLFSCFGRKVHVVQTLDRPIAVDSLKQLAAIECVKPDELDNFLSAMGPDIGMEGRDFLGRRVYTMDASNFAMMAPMPVQPGMAAAGETSMSIGIGGALAFVGPTSAVEQALRTVADPQNASLGDEAAFQRACALLQNEKAIAWGYADVLDGMEAQMEVARLQMEQLMEELQAQDPDIAAELGDLNVSQMGAGMEILEQIDYDLLRQYIGPSAWDAVATDDGFLIRSYTLAAEGK
jgi:hypothetical protein